MRKAQRTFLFTLISFTLIASLLSCSKVEQEQEVKEPLEAVSAATDYTQIVSSSVAIEKRALRDRVIGSGTVQGQREVSIKARVSGEIEDISIELGNTLTAGDTLLIIDNTIASLNLSQLEKQYENAVKQQAVNEKLFASGAISLSQLNQGKSSLDGLAAQMEQARNNVTNSRVTTPISGSVAEITKLVEGDLLQAGSQIARIVDLEHLRVTLAIGQAQLFLIKEGAPAEITIRTPTETIVAEGLVSAISASSDSRTGSWTVYVDFDNPRPDILKAGITADVTIFNNDAPLYTVVPNGAMVNRNGKQYIFVVDGSNASLQEVTVVDQFGDLTAIESKDASSPLLGERVLVSSLSRLIDGSAISTPLQ
nr:efflux RND transporter periplasmic adaptor subunit [uncultured Sphaerochaeta sp.]